MAGTPSSSRGALPSQWTVGSKGDLTITPDDATVVPFTIQLPVGAAAAGSDALQVKAENARVLAQLDAYASLTLSADTVDPTNGVAAVTLKDHLNAPRVLIQADGGQGAAPLATSKFDTVAGDALGFYNVNVVQQSHIADPSGGAIIDAQSRTAINAILDALEAYGLLKTV